MPCDQQVQLGDLADGDLWEAVELLLSRMRGKVEVKWVRGHSDRRVAVRGMTKEQRGNVRADANSRSWDEKRTCNRLRFRLFFSSS